MMARCHHDVKMSNPGMSTFTPPLDVVSKKAGRHIAVHPNDEDVDKDGLCCLFSS